MAGAVHNAEEVPRHWKRQDVIVMVVEMDWDLFVLAALDTFPRRNENRNVATA